MGRSFNLARQQGIGLVTAIFLVVGLAALGAAMISVMSSTAASSGLDVDGARAYQAAKAGAEWGVFQARRNASCLAATTFVLPGAMGGYSATVTCSSVSVTTTTGTIVRFRVTSTGCNVTTGACPTVTNDPGYVQRVVEVRFGG